MCLSFQTKFPPPGTSISDLIVHLQKASHVPARLGPDMRSVIFPMSSAMRALAPSESLVPRSYGLLGNQVQDDRREQERCWISACTCPVVEEGVCIFLAQEVAFN